MLRESSATFRSKMTVTWKSIVLSTWADDKPFAEFKESKRFVYCFAIMIGIFKYAFLEHVFEHFKKANPSVQRQTENLLPSTDEIS